MSKQLRHIGSFRIPETGSNPLDLLPVSEQLTLYRVGSLSGDEQTLASLVRQLEAMGVTLVVAPEVQGESCEK
jgi:hypothetical protein